ncbi:hypothetical protein TEA_011529 [Camellia sinensis var. sinensis]|uniref:AB hydrolase-1 domain-containing protein n=1 Tax=Camellia sinensis var. sinensis TaxID=542762 RepID=A0A4S4F0L7_CAMSN|nr:hypothetical protein TEA_011529 [Camellia sinensis var. sinensis]
METPWIVSSRGMSADTTCHILAGALPSCKAHCANLWEGGMLIEGYGHMLSYSCYRLVQCLECAMALGGWFSMISSLLVSSVLSVLWLQSSKHKAQVRIDSYCSVLGLLFVGGCYFLIESGCYFLIADLECARHLPIHVLQSKFDPPSGHSDHWRKNIPVLACSHRVFSIDLIGYGYSDKPNPSDFEANSFYTFETWAAQLNDFCIDVVKDKAFFICNSIGGVVGLQAAVREPEVCTGIILLNLSLRMLHIKKQPWYGRPLIRSFQSLLRNTALGKFFYKSVATPESVRSILCQCYHDTSQVTDELVEAILLPGLEPGAADVFLEFICYSGGPLPEELLPQVKCPVLIAWGDKDPWEPIELGRAYDKFDSVEDFIVLPNVGHCPQDEAPHLVNPIVESFVARHATPQRAHGIATVYFMRNAAYSSS